MTKKCLQLYVTSRLEWPLTEISFSFQLHSFFVQLAPFYLALKIIKINQYMMLRYHQKWFKISSVRNVTHCDVTYKKLRRS